MDKPEAYKGREPYIFISYKHNDKQMKEGEIFKFVNRLQQDGYRVWYDQGLEPGTHFDEEIAMRLEGCRIFLCILSEEYFMSNWCSTELDNAFEFNKIIVPVFLQSDMPISKGKAFKLRSWHAIYKSQSDSLMDLVPEIYRTREIEQCCAKGISEEAEVKVTSMEPKGPAKELSVKNVERQKNIDTKKTKWVLVGGTVLVCLLIIMLFSGKGKEDADMTSTGKTNPTKAATVTETVAPTEVAELTDAPMATEEPILTAAPTTTEVTPTPTEVAEIRIFSEKYLSEMEAEVSENLVFSTFKQTDTLGNEYRGNNIANITMNDYKNGYATYYVGGEYQYLSGIIAVNDTSAVVRTGVFNVYVATDESEWELIYQTETLHRSVAPFEMEVDISGADWVYIEYLSTGGNGDRIPEATLVLIDFAFSKEKRELMEISMPNYEDEVLLSNIKMTEGVACSFVTAKQIDTAGNEYTGGNVLKIEMNDDINGYATWYAGSEYQYLTGIVTPNDKNNLVRRGVLRVYTKVNGGEWYLAYESMEIDRAIAPFEINVDISGADWVMIQFCRADSLIYLNDMAGVLLVDCVFTQKDSKEMNIPIKDYGDEVQISKVKVSEGEEYNFVTTKQTDVVGKEYKGDNILLLNMNDDIDSYVMYYVGAGYQRLTGTVALSAISHEERVGNFQVFTKANNNDVWNLRYECNEIDCSTEPFSLDVDISDADWLLIQFVREDLYIYMDDIAQIILVDGVLTKEVQ